MTDRLRARLRALDNGDKQILFVLSGILTLGHLAALTTTAIARDLAPIGAVLLIDAQLAILGGLIWMARRLFPTKGDDRG